MCLSFKNWPEPKLILQIWVGCSLDIPLWCAKTMFDNYNGSCEIQVSPGRVPNKLLLVSCGENMNFPKSSTATE